MARRGDVRPDGHPHRAFLVAGDAHRDGQPGGVAVRGDHHRRPERTTVLGPHTDDPPAAQHRLGDVRPLDQPGTATDGVAGEQLVQLRPSPGHAVVREVGQLGPVEGERTPVAAVDPQPTVVHPAGILRGVQAETDQLLDRPGSQAVTADLVPGEGGLLQQCDVEAQTGQVGGSGGAAGAGTDDHHVMLGHHITLG
ncbi:hypothetical protein SDC9_162681 [bioreactor metagenome]|uniref:Uncharacterized protein n=1 Tax=bioreactor metagenome TaxID=1076179 RepID=A0A645FN26_9ZZZZ